jgi:hypothetical protein
VFHALDSYDCILCLFNYYYFLVKAVSSALITIVMNPRHPLPVLFLLALRKLLSLFFFFFFCLLLASEIS